MMIVGIQTNLISPVDNDYFTFKHNLDEMFQLPENDA